MSLSSILEFVRKIDRAYTGACRQVMEKFGLSKTSVDILMFLADNPECCTARDASAMLGIKANVVSVHVDRLVNEGCLERRPVPEDRRKIRLVCTEKAGPIIRDGRSAQEKFHRDLEARLTPEDLETFRHCFEVITGNAERMQLEPQPDRNPGGGRPC